MRKEWVCWWCEEDGILKFERRPAEIASWWTDASENGSIPGGIFEDPFDAIEPHDDGLRVNIHKGLKKFTNQDLWQTIVDVAKG